MGILEQNFREMVEEVPTTTVIENQIMRKQIIAKLTTKRVSTLKNGLHCGVKTHWIPIAPLGGRVKSGAREYVLAVRNRGHWTN